MRTYGKNYKAHPSTVKRTTVKEYADRESTEWDVRLDLVNGTTSSTIFDHLVAHKSKIKYAFLGAEEAPDTNPNYNTPRAYGTASEEIHVHIAIIMEKPCKKGDVLQLLRGPRPIGKGNEYAVPRNTKFTYAGWIAHHSKELTKVNPQGPFHLLEYGDLPMDSYDESGCWRVIKIIKKFGNPEMRERFKSYSDKIDALKKMRKELEADADYAIERVAAGLDEEEKEPAVAPGYYIPEIQGKLGGKILKID